MTKMFVGLGSFVLGVGCTNLSVGPAPSGGGTLKGKTEQGSAEIADRGAERFRDLASVRAFQSLRTALSQQFEIVLADSETEREAFEGMRALLRILAMATDTALDGNPKAPHFARMDTKVRKVGGDNPDAEYDAVRLDNEWDLVTAKNTGFITPTAEPVAYADRADTGADNRTANHLNGNLQLVAPMLSMSFAEGNPAEGGSTIWTRKWNLNFVPEPSSLGLIGAGTVGLIGLAAARRRKRS